MAKFRGNCYVLRQYSSSSMIDETFPASKREEVRITSGRYYENLLAQSAKL